MFDHDADKRRGAGLTAFNPLAEGNEGTKWPKDLLGVVVDRPMPDPRPLPSFEMLDRLETMLRTERIERLINPPGFLPASIKATDPWKEHLASLERKVALGATGCLSSPEYPKGMNGPTGGAPPHG